MGFIELLVQHFNVTKSYLMGEDDDTPAPLPSNVRQISALHHQRVPMIGSVAAGEPIYDPEELGVYVEAPVDADAAITIRGDSMIPTYQDGDVVYIKCRPDVPEGAVAVVFLDNEATLKHVYKRRTGLTLISDNPAHPPIMAEFEDYDGKITIFGVPVGYTRIFKPDPLKKIKKGF
jgi:repressor LexA